MDKRTLCMFWKSGLRLSTHLPIVNGIVINLRGTVISPFRFFRVNRFSRHFCHPTKLSPLTKKFLSPDEFALSQEDIFVTWSERIFFPWVYSPYIHQLRHSRCFASPLHAKVGQSLPLLFPCCCCHTDSLFALALCLVVANIQTPIAHVSMN
jgi:hypothetical protein